MYMSKAKRDTLATMVLAHRVAVRRHASLTGDDWLEASCIETITQYAIDLVLEPWQQYKADYINSTLAEMDTGSDAYMSAYVASIRLETMGVSLEEETT